MINYKQLREQYKRYRLESTDGDRLYTTTVLGLFIVFVIAVVAMCVLPGCAAAGEITEIQAVRAILGEAEGESLVGMTAIAEVIRTRGNMQGIYGYHAVKYTNGVYYRGHRHILNKIALQALKAWKDSSTTHYSANAQGWGSRTDLEAFHTQSWFRKCVIVAKYGNHYFWRAK